MVAADIDWTNVTIAGAFILGQLVGVVVVVRLLSVLAEYLRRERGKEQ